MRNIIRYIAKRKEDSYAKRTSQRHLAHPQTFLCYIPSNRLGSILRRRSTSWPFNGELVLFFAEKLVGKRFSCPLLLMSLKNWKEPPPHPYIMNRSLCYTSFKLATPPWKLSTAIRKETNSCNFNEHHLNAFPIRFEITSARRFHFPRGGISRESIKGEVGAKVLCTVHK